MGISIVWARATASALNARTGLAHTLINNTERDVRLFVMTEAFRRNSLATSSARSRPANENLRKMGMLWAMRRSASSVRMTASRARAPGRKRGKPDFVAHWRDILNKKAEPLSGQRRRPDARRALRQSRPLLAHRHARAAPQSPGAARAGRTPSATRTSSSMSSRARSMPGTTVTSRRWARATSSAGRAAPASPM